MKASKEPRQVRTILLLALLGLLVLCCSNSPTVPLPPPEAVTVSYYDEETDELGFVTVTGPADSADHMSIILLYNENLEFGVMEPAEDDGSFEASIEADIGHQLVLQYKMDDNVSHAAYITVKASEKASENPSDTE